MKLGVITDGIDRDLGVALPVARAAGLEFAELQYVGDKEVGDHSAAEQSEIRRRLDDAGMRASCVSRHLFSRLSVMEAAPTDAAYREQIDALARCVEFAHSLGTRLVRIMSFRRETILFGGGGAEEWIVARGAWEKFVTLLAPVLRVAERENILLVVETGNGGMIHSAFQARRLLDSLGAAGDGRLAALWDPANCLYCGETPHPDGAAALAGKRLGHLHIKDARVRPPRSTVDFCELGKGDMAPYLRAIADGLRAEKYDGVVSLESVYRPDGGDFKDGFAASIELFKSIFGAQAD